MRAKPGEAALLGVTTGSISIESDNKQKPDTISHIASRVTRLAKP